MSGRCSARLKRQARRGRRGRARRCAGRSARRPRSPRPRGTGAVEESAGDQLDLGPGAGQRRGKGVVVGRREGRRIDELDAHAVRMSCDMAGDYRGRLAPTLSYCVVNTNGREYLLACLDAIERTHPAGVEREVLVLDNASTTARPRRCARSAARSALIELRAPDRQGGERLDPAARGARRVLPAAERGLRAAAGRRRRRCSPRSKPTRRPPRRRRSCSTPTARPVPCAWRFPGVGTALAGALFLHRRSPCRAGGETRQVDWAQSSALLVRREAAEQVGYLDPAFFVYYDECDFAKRLADAGWHTLFVPAAEAVHHDQLATDLAAGLPRIVEFHRNRDLYMRKHHGARGGARGPLLTAWSYAVRALAAVVVPGQPAARLPGPRAPGPAPRPRRGIRERGRADSRA